MKSYEQTSLNTTTAMSSIEKTVDVYLDSDQAELIGGKYHFLVQPSISNYYGSKARCYIKDMSFMNTLMNIRGSTSERTLNISVTDPNGATLPDKFHVFPESRHQSGSVWADTLNDIFGTPGGSQYAYVEFTWDEFTQRMNFDCATGYSIRFFQNEKINLELLKFVGSDSGGSYTNPRSSGTSTSVVDLNNGLHGIFMVCDEVTPDLVNIGTDKPGKMVRIPVNTGIGGYVYYSQRLPIHRSTFDSDTTNKLTIELFDDAERVFNPNRWTATLTVEFYKKPVNNQLHTIHNSSRNPPLIRP